MTKWDNPPEAVWVWGKYGKYEETYCHAEEIKQEEFWYIAITQERNRAALQAIEVEK